LDFREFRASRDSMVRQAFQTLVHQVHLGNPDLEETLDPMELQE